MSENETGQRSWWDGVKSRARATRDALVNYLPTGIVAATVMTAGASAIGASGMLGGFGNTIGHYMGAPDLATGALKVARIVGVGLLINGVMGMGRRPQAAHDGTAAAASATPAAKNKEEPGHSMGLEHGIDFVPGFAQNDVQIESQRHLPLNPRGAAPNQIV